MNFENNKLEVNLNDNKNKEKIESSSSFSLEQLKLSQSFSENLKVKKIINNIPCKKPNRHEFVRVHPDTEMHIETATLEFKEDRQIYLVNPKLWNSLSSEIKPQAIFTVINRQGELSLWPVNLPGEDGSTNPWNQSAIDAVEAAKTKWIRVIPNMSSGSYDIFIAEGNIPEPEWPVMSFSKIMEISFKGKYIETLDHPVLKALRGEI